MTCPRCQHDNPAGAKFCDECGAALEAACAACGEANRAGAKFCRKCGKPLTRFGVSGHAATATFASPESYTPKHLAEKIVTSKRALEGERKHVTVLFADLKGSMELLADRDPEEARKILDPVLERMMDAVHRYEGTVNQVMGDGIMALFGAPLAHEDHAVRACYAALRMQVTIGSDLRMDYTAVGQTTHLAARMEQLARPGSILLTPWTLELVESLVAVKPLGPVPVKGLGDAVEVYEVTGAGPARTRLQAAARRGLTRFVGRDAEVEQLRRAQQLAGAGHGQVAAVIGEAGVGKSRLVYEFTHSHRLHGWLVLESASVSYGKATSYLPVIELLKGYFKIQDRDRDDLREIREKVTGKLLTLDRALEPTLPALLALLDVSGDNAAWQALEPAERRRRTLDAVRRLLLREAREQPLLLIFEDLHWIDGETQALLDGLVESLGSARMLLLVNFRPEYQHGWGSKTYYSQIRLDALPPESAEALLDALLSDDPGLAPLKQLLVKRGNPFFLEETVRTLVETKALAGERGRYRLTQPIQAIQVPPTVQVMLAARIDRLPPEEKRLLQVASVVGKDAAFTLLQAIAELPDDILRRGLDHLQSAEFLYEAGLYPDLEYSFTHALTHEVTYGGLLQERRRELHARIVEAIERLHADRVVEHIDRLAYHAVRGELWQEAVHYARQAGGKAAARSALQEARVWFEQALDALVALPETQSVLEEGFEPRLELRVVLGQLGEVQRARECLREAEALADRLDDDHRRGLVCVFVMNIRSQLGELDEALASGRRALTIARRLGDLDLRIRTTTYLEQAHYFRGEYERVVELATDNLAALPADRVDENFGIVVPPSVYDRAWLVMSLAHLGRFAAALDHGAEAIRLAEPTHHAFIVGLAYRSAGTVHLLQGDWVRARSLIEHATAEVRRGNVLLSLPYAVASSAWGLAQLGEAREALNRLREGEQLLERQATKGYVSQLGWAYHSLGRASLLLGRLDEARRLGDRAIESSPRHPGFAAHAVHLLGDIATHPDRFDAETGEAHYRQALTLAEPRGMRPLVAHCHLGLGRLHSRVGEREPAQEHLTTAITMYREMDMRFWLDQADAALGEAQ